MSNQFLESSSENYLEEEIFRKIKWLTNNFSSEKVEISLHKNWLEFGKKNFEKFLEITCFNEDKLSLIKRKFKNNTKNNPYFLIEKIDSWYYFSLWDDSPWELFFWSIEIKADKIISNSDEDNFFLNLNQLLDLSWNILEEDWEKIKTDNETEFIKWKVIWILNKDIMENEVELFKELWLSREELNELDKDYLFYFSDKEENKEKRKSIISYMKAFKEYLSNLWIRGNVKAFWIAFVKIIKSWNLFEIDYIYEKAIQNIKFLYEEWVLISVEQLKNDDLYFIYEDIDLENFQEKRKYLNIYESKNPNLSIFYSEISLEDLEYLSSRHWPSEEKLEKIITILLNKKWKWYYDIINTLELMNYLNESDNKEWDINLLSYFDDITYLPEIIKKSGIYMLKNYEYNQNYGDSVPTFDDFYNKKLNIWDDWSSKRSLVDNFSKPLKEITTYFFENKENISISPFLLLVNFVDDHTIEYKDFEIFLKAFKKYSYIYWKKIELLDSLPENEKKDFNLNHMKLDYIDWDFKKNYYLPLINEKSKKLRK